MQLAEKIGGVNECSGYRRLALERSLHEIRGMRRRISLCDDFICMLYVLFTSQNLFFSLFIFSRVAAERGPPLRHQHPAPCVIVSGRRAGET